MIYDQSAIVSFAGCNYALWHCSPPSFADNDNGIKLNRAAIIICFLKPRHRRRIPIIGPLDLTGVDPQWAPEAFNHSIKLPRTPHVKVNNRSLANYKTNDIRTTEEDAAAILRAVFPIIRATACIDYTGISSSERKAICDPPPPNGEMVGLVSAAHRRLARDCCFICLILFIYSLRLSDLARRG